MRAHRIADWPAYVALAAILVGGVALRVMTLHHGLPWTYHADEAFHFVTRAVNMFQSGGLDPGYFENPTAYTYLVYTALRVTEGTGFLWRDVQGIGPAFAANPTEASRPAHPRRDPVGGIIIFPRGVVGAGHAGDNEPGAMARRVESCS